MQCPICNSRMTPRFTAKDFQRPDASNSWTLMWCQPCSYGRLGDELDPATVSSFYQDDYYTHGAAERPDVKRASLLSRLRRHLAWRLDYGRDFDPAEIDLDAGRERPTVCDIGCGNGDQLRKFKRLGYDCYGVEPDAKARRLAADVGEVYEGTGEELPEPISRRAFDVVFLSHSLEHCIDPLRVLANVRRLVKPGGRLVIEVPNGAADGFAQLGPIWPWADVPRHIHVFSESSLRSLLRDRGFAMRRAYYTGFNRNFDDSWLAMQNKIAAVLAPGRDFGFERRSWAQLIRGAFLSRARKYDSIRVHAHPV